MCACVLRETYTNVRHRTTCRLVYKKMGRAANPLALHIEHKNRRRGVESTRDAPSIEPGQYVKHVPNFVRRRPKSKEGGSLPVGPQCPYCLGVFLSVVYSRKEMLAFYACI